MHTFSQYAQVGMSCFDFVDVVYSVVERKIENYEMDVFFLWSTTMSDAQTDVEVCEKQKICLVLAAHTFSHCQHKTN